MGNKLWVFGDSFSTDLPPYDQKFTYWFEYLAKELGIRLENTAIGGKSTQHILFDVIENLNNINSGDYVSIGLSETRRDFLPISTAVDLGLLNNPNTYKHDYIYSSGGMYFEGLDRERQRIYNEYLIEFRNENGSELYHFYNRLAQSLTSHLNSLGCKVIWWNHDEGTLHENWTQHSNGKIIDGHWSPNGHKTFYLKMLENFKKNF